MAITLQRRINFSLGQAVAGRIAAFQKSRAELQVQDELKFFQEVNTRGLSFEDQLTFRKAQLERENGRTVPDNDYIGTIKKEIATLTKNVRYEKLRIAFQTSLTDVVNGSKSLGDHKSFLEQKLSQTKDPDLTKQIRDEIFSITEQMRTAEQQLLENKINMAIADKSKDLLNQAISSVKKEKSKALGAGDSVRAEALDLKLMSLKQTLSSVKIEDKLTDLQVKKLNSGVGAISYLKEIGNALAAADDSQPVTIEGKRFNSEVEYWNLVRNNYLNNTFFDELNNEYKGYIDSVVTSTGFVPESVLATIQSDFTQLASRPEVAPFAQKLEMARTQAIGKAVNETATAIINRYAIDQDYGRAIGELENLQKTYTIDQTTNMQKVLLDESGRRGQFFQNVLSDISGLVAQGQSFAQASNTVFGAINAGTGQVLAPKVSPLDVVTKTPQDLIKSAPETTKQQTDPLKQPTLNSLSTPLPTLSSGFNLSEYLASRPSSANPSILEFYNPKTQVGYSTPGAVFKDFIGKRPSSVNPSVTEYYNTKTNTGFKDIPSVLSFANSLGVQQVKQLGELDTYLK